MHKRHGSIQRPTWPDWSRYLQQLLRVGQPLVLVQCSDSRRGIPLAEKSGTLTQSACGKAMKTLAFKSSSAFRSWLGKNHG
jgi:hypothetical protein